MDDLLNLLAFSTPYLASGCPCQDTHLSGQHSHLAWVPTLMPGCCSCGHFPLPTQSLTWSHCASLLCLHPSLCACPPSVTPPPNGFRTGLSRKGRQGGRGKMEGGGRKGKGRALGSFWYQLKLISACSLSAWTTDQLTICYSTFIVLRQLGVEDGMQRGVKNIFPAFQKHQGTWDENIKSKQISFSVECYKQYVLQKR